MKLSGENVVAPHRRGKRLAVVRRRRNDRRVLRLGKKTVHKINVAATGDAPEERASRPGHRELVPPDLRNFQSRLFLEANDVPAKNSQARGATVEFLAPGKQG